MNNSKSSMAGRFHRQPSGMYSLQEFRDRVMMMVGLTLIIFLSPFILLAIYKDYYVLAFIISCVVSISALNAFYIYRGQKPKVPYWIFYLMVFLAVTLAIITQGNKSLLWAYPSLFVMGFVTESKISRIITIVALITISGLAFYVDTLEFASRFVISLCMTCYFTHLLVDYFSKLNDKLIELAIRDPLTNAFNRRQLDSFLYEAIEETKRDFGPASLILLDIDHFKHINDNFGHETGDLVLKKIVEILHLRQRRLDYVFRIGGEEFLILLRNTSMQQALANAENLRFTIANSELIDKQKITISLGVAEYSAGESPNEWLARVDEYLYQAKKSGRDQVQPLVSE